MEPGQKITVRFGCGPLRGLLTFEFPPAGQWEWDEEGSYFQPINGNPNALQGSCLTFSVVNDPDMITGAEGSTCWIAAHEADYPDERQLSTAPELAAYSVPQLIRDLASRPNFRGVIVRESVESDDAPEVAIAPCYRDAPDLLKSAIRHLRFERDKIRD